MNKNLIALTLSEATAISGGAVYLCQTRDFGSDEIKSARRGINEETTGYDACEKYACHPEYTKKHDMFLSMAFPDTHVDIDTVLTRGKSEIKNLWRLCGVDYTIYNKK